ncbi:MAG: lytic transglycosylase domain-containing protein [Bryobacteraceae bacterium]|nr:lytic transglycosylase domain-containing protein [Bryobacterales bacterium]NUN01098.1 lytic transglycosylase domain-containing protein [Bryobacteraceae bacterium]
MRNCLASVTLLCTGGLVLSAANYNNAARVTSVVKTDQRSGRLVRRVVVKRAPVRTISAKTTAGAANSGVIDIPRIVELTAAKYDLDPLLVHSVIQAESNYDPFAVSPKGAQGLMQLMPATAKRFGVQNAFRAEQNIEGGVRYLRYLHDLFRNPTLALAAYNAGEGAVWKYNNTVPPYAETQSYVRRVAGKLSKARSAKESGTSGPAGAVTDETEGAPAEDAAYRPVVSFVDGSGRLYLKTE